MGIFELFTPQGIMNMLYGLPGLLIAITFHEFAHAYSAHLLGDDTARHHGRMSLSPVAHFDLVGFICLLIFRFGWAKPVPINPGRLKYGRYGDLIVSLSGVVTNFILAFIFTLIYYACALINFDEGIKESLLIILSSTVQINVFLCIFNFIPVPPLDGYHVLRDLTVGPWRGGPFFDFVERYGFFILIGLLFTGVTSFIIGLFASPIIFLFNTIAGLIFGF